MKAIDVHGHFGDLDNGTGSLAGRLRSGDIDVVRRRAQAVDIRLTVVSACRALAPYGGDVLRGNEEAQQVAEQWPDVSFWAVLDPRRPATYKQVERLLSDAGCEGIKLHPVLHSYEICEWGEAIFEFAASQKALILTHSGDPGSFPEDFVPFANQFPVVRLILAHLGNSEWEDRFTRQAVAVQRAEAGNVFADSSSIMSMNSGLIEWAVAEIGSERLLFGTDTPLYSAAAHKARIEYAEIDEAAKAAILFENARRLLRARDYLD